MTKSGKISEARAKLYNARAVEPDRVEHRLANVGAVARRERRKAAGVEGWCILRTSGNRTLPLARSLGKAGFEVWTPHTIQSWRRPRSTAQVERDVPMMPSFVFVRADRLFDIARVLALPINPHPPFSIFRHAGRVPVIGDGEVGNLRALEEHAAEVRRLAERKARRQALIIGQQVRLPGEGFVGLLATVEASTDKIASVRVGGLSMKIETWRVLDDDVLTAPPTEGSAARAA